MRLEVLVENGDVQVFPLNRPKIYLGSGENCEIIISSQGVSRKHVCIVTENDQYYVVDQGSTNGSFINEERLVPGKKVEFTSFFPVRLGENVLLTLLSDEDVETSELSEYNQKKEATSPSIKVKEDNDSTRSISLKDLQQVKTQKLVEKRIELEKTKTIKKKAPLKAPAKNDESRMGMVKILAALIILGAGYLNFFHFKSEENTEAVTQVGKIVKPTKEFIEANQPKSFLVPESDLVPHNKLLQLLSDIRCVNELEKYLCDNIRNANVNPWGVIQVKLNFNILIDGTPYIDEARKFLYHLPANATEADRIQQEKDLREIAMAAFLVYGLPKDLNPEMFKDHLITVALISPTQDKVEAAAALSYEGLKEFKNVFNERALFSMRSEGMRMLIPLRSIYKVY
jgi:pSer/pThr/pTyr-binding forkhead associated (FHA) protein